MADTLQPWYNSRWNNRAVIRVEGRSSSYEKTNVCNSRSQQPCFDGFLDRKNQASIFIFLQYEHRKKNTGNAFDVDQRVCSSKQKHRARFMRGVCSNSYVEFWSEMFFFLQFVSHFSLLMKIFVRYSFLFFFG